jgi:hypothetical protein
LNGWIKNATERGLVTQSANPAEQMIAQYLLLGRQLDDDQARQGIAGLLRRFRLVISACRNVPGITRDHLLFAAKASRAIRTLQPAPRATISAEDVAVLMGQLMQLQENSRSAVDPACLTFCQLREDALTETARETLIWAARSANLLSHADAQPIVCCIPAATPHLLEIIIRDHKAFDYKILVLDLPAGDVAVSTSVSAVALGMTFLMPVLGWQARGGY